MADTYKKLKEIIKLNTAERFNFIEEEINILDLNKNITFFEAMSPRGDKHMSLNFLNDAGKEIWLTANYDTYQNFPSANNNASGVMTLLGLGSKLKEKDLPVGVRLFFLDYALDPKLVSAGRRDPDFVPGSELLLNYLIDNETDFIDKYLGTITVQAVGKGNLCVFKRTGKKDENSKYLNDKIISFGQTNGVIVDLQDQSPLADNLSFLKQGLDATVLSRYHEGAWHKMQTPKDDINNVNAQLVDETAEFLLKVLQTYKE
ncbi:hypothetical protein COV13_02065 [Candidatus Woesearchaeota archaeon CG10_big_fil_rev_8_21_14_0_10_32_9]|nr:MAG: hypothetical protein COV13_02065 [Candidatus Woesearchaeota archaeon CG10_big_fil_rev_8_21_14_0_10_32_9]